MSGAPMPGSGGVGSGSGSTSGSGDAEHRSLDWNDLDATRFFTYGTVCFFGVRLVTYPLLVVKTRLQVQRGNSQYSGLVDATRSIVRSEGVRGLYKGFLPSSFNPFLRQLYFGAYEGIRTSMATVNARTNTFTREQLEPVRNLVAGAISSTLYQVVTNPIDVISQRMMMEAVGARGTNATPATATATATATGSASASSAGSGGLMTRVTREIWTTSGWRGFYRGFVISTLQFSPSSAVWWASYEQYAQWIKPRLPTSEAGWSARRRDALTHAGAGFGAGCTAVFFSNPVDVVRTRLQVDKNLNASMLATYKTLIAEEGYRGLFKGVTARMTSFGPVSVLILSVYEWVKRISQKTPTERARDAAAAEAERKRVLLIQQSATA